MAYSVDATNAASPADTDDLSYAAAELRALKNRINAFTGVSGVNAYKNKLINGNMLIDQLLEYTVGNLVGSNLMAADMWTTVKQTAGATVAVQNLSNSAFLLAGFDRRIRINTTVAAAPVAGNVNVLFTRVEGFNCSDLQWGTANAKTVALSFWVACGVTGALAGSITNSGLTRSYTFNYTINAASTWEYKTVVIPGDTAGVWATDNTVGLQVTFDLGSGTTYETATLNAWQAGLSYRNAAAIKVVNNVTTFHLTGVQLEIGTGATAFDGRDYATELLRCQRYYEKSFASGVVPAQNTGLTGVVTAAQCVGAATSQDGIYLPYKVVKRATPTVTFYNPSAANAQARNVSTATDCTITVLQTSGDSGGGLSLTTPAGSAAGQRLIFHFTTDIRL